MKAILMLALSALQLQRKHLDAWFDIPQTRRIRCIDAREKETRVKVSPFFSAKPNKESFSLPCWFGFDNSMPPLTPFL
ncbi:MAG TPA: hypothetical protein VEC35_02250 [Noviherbaspirillum sp.]|nr:hypothetical protein [Noviherbaspirillum sp.]